MTSKAIAIAATATLAVLAAPVATAHDVVVGGNPANGEVVQEFPESLTLEFSGQPREGFNSFAVTNQATSEVLFSAEPTLDGRLLTVNVPDNVNPGPGEYRIGFQITSSDGHSTRGWSDFTVQDGTGSPETAEQAAEESSAQSDQAPAEAMPMWAVVGIGLVAVLAIVAVVVLIIRKGKMSDDLRSKGSQDEHPEND